MQKRDFEAILIIFLIYFLFALDDTQASMQAVKLNLQQRTCEGLIKIFIRSQKQQNKIKAFVQDELSRTEKNICVGKVHAKLLRLWVLQ